MAPHDKPAGDDALTDHAPTNQAPASHALSGGTPTDSVASAAAATANTAADPEDAAAEVDEPETGPLRRCAVTRTQGERARMVRFVVGPDRTVVPDVLARLPGRGIWLSARRDVLETARARGAFSRAARGSVSVPADLVDTVEAGLVRRIVELLGLARRAGQAVAGFGKARDWVVAGRTGLMVQASDGSPEERVRILSGARHVPVVTPLPAIALGGVFGRDHVVHVAVVMGRLADGLRIEAERLAGVSGRMDGGGAAAPVGLRGGTSAPVDARGDAVAPVDARGGPAATQGDGTGGV